MSIRKELKQYCDEMKIELLEYMGRTKWYTMNTTKNYKTFRIETEHKNSVHSINTVYYYMARDVDGKIIYIGHTGNNDYSCQIVKLSRPESVYKKGMYILNKSGNISPMKNGHTIKVNCWETQRLILIWG